MSNQQKLERRAEILVEVACNPKQQEKIAERHGYSVRALQLWRKDLETDAVFSQIFASKMERAKEGWADEIPSALRAAVNFLRRAAEDCDTKDPSAIHAIAGGMKLLSETAATWKVLDARIAKATQGVQASAQPPPLQQPQPAASPPN
jgi:hypothetical protein